MGHLPKKKNNNFTVLGLELELFPVLQKYWNQIVLINFICIVLPTVNGTTMTLLNLFQVKKNALAKLFDNRIIKEPQYITVESEFLMIPLQKEIQTCLKLQCSETALLDTAIHTKWEKVVKHMHTLMACPKKPFPRISPWMRSQGRKIRWEQLEGRTEGFRAPDISS